MASVFKRDGAWVVKWRDGNGRWRYRRTSCRTKELAKKLANDLEQKAERQQEGLEPRPGQLAKMTFGELLEWWWKEYGSKLRSSTPGPFANKHLRPELGELLLAEVTLRGSRRCSSPRRTT